MGKEIKLEDRSGGVSVRVTEEKDGSLAFAFDDNTGLHPTDVTVFPSIEQAQKFKDRVKGLQNDK